MKREIKFEVMIEALEDAKGHKKGDRLKLTNPIFDRGVGIAFFEIGLKWGIVWQRQFTGLKDKNGGDIYEGDIFHCSGVNYVLRLLNIGGAYTVHKITDETDERFLFHCNEQIEVIGNIYENKELLNK